MIRVHASSRLHFGLLSLPEEPAGASQPPGRSPRRFGSVGLMVKEPGLTLSAQPAQTWSAEGPLAERALAFATQLAETLPPDLRRPQRLVVEQCPPEHQGLGTGTQLGLAVARAVSLACGCGEIRTEDLAIRTERGSRSALGIHGFIQGGFLVDGGKPAPEPIAPLIARADFPEPWRVVLVIPPWTTGLHGNTEREVFQDLHRHHMPLARTNILCRLVLLGMLPALAERDLNAFGEAVFEFNALVGETFLPFQGGLYADPRLEEVVDFIRHQGVRGVGQSSWGPSLFALTKDNDQALHLAGEIRGRFALAPTEVLITSACNHGARIDHGDQPTA